MIIKLKSNKDVRPEQDLAVSFIQLDEYDKLIKMELINNLWYGAYFSKYNIKKYLNAMNDFGILGKGAPDDYI